MLSNSKDIGETELLSRLSAEAAIRSNDSLFEPVLEIVTRTQELSVQLNASTHIDRVRDRLSEIIGSSIDKSTRIFPPILHQLRTSHYTRQKCFYQSCLLIPRYGWHLHRRRCFDRAEGEPHHRKPSFRSNRQAIAVVKGNLHQTQCMDWCSSDDTTRCYHWRKRCSSRRSSSVEGCSCKYCSWWYSRQAH
jgi:hypothetical protein